MKSNRMKVLHSAGTWLPQTHIWMYNQIRYLPDYVEPHIVCNDTMNLEQFNLPNIYSSQNKSGIRAYWDRGIKKLGIRQYSSLLIDVAKRNDFKILHSHNGYNGWANVDAAQRLGIKHVVAFYGADAKLSDELWKKRYAKLFATVDAVLCEGHLFAETLVKLGCSREKIRVHHLGVPLDQIGYAPRSWNKNEPLRILIAATFAEKKGIPYALEAISRIQHEITLEITIIGDATGHAHHQIEKKVILELIKRYGLTTKTRILGYQPYSVILSESYKHHLFISPSITATDGDTEGGAPVVLIDMAATGIPIISSRHCDIPEIIKDGETGLLAEERNIEELAAHLRWYFQHPEEWKKITEAGRKHMELEYDAKKQGEKLADIYKNI